jgi:hypothetical protein
MSLISRGVTDTRLIFPPTNGSIVPTSLIV